MYSLQGNHTRAATIACLTALMGLAQTPVEAGITDALVNGKPNLDMRLRYEHVEQDNALKDADALTLRSRLGYTTDNYMGWKAMLEMEDVRAIGDADFNSTTNGHTGYSVVADPSETEINQAYLDYASSMNTDFRYGRQRIIYDNARFVGNVGWRQNEQTFDAFSVRNRSVTGLSLQYAYVTNVNRIFGDASPNGNFAMSTHLVNLGYTGLPVGELTGYGYFLEFDDPSRSANSSKTLGLRYSGTLSAGGLDWPFLLEYADQSDYKDGAASIDASYWHLEGGVRTMGVTAKLGYERLGGDGTYGFSTPLATLHAFNGWADQFLSTPANGLEDAYLSVGGKLSGVKLLAVYHDFSADSGGQDYGSEWDLLAAKKFAGHYTVGMKYAAYDADAFSVDTDKLWLWGQLSF